MKVLIIGAGGMLGHDLVDVLGKENEISTPNTQTLDITDIHQTIEKIKTFKPHVVIHAAAYTDVNGSQSNEDLAYKLNALGTRNVAVSCNEADCAMVYISTDYVFDGKKGSPYFEYDQPNPLNVYGKTKYLGEVFVHETLNKFYIVRTSWLYGLHGTNFPKTMLKLAKTNDNLSVVNDQIGSPTYTLDLAKAVSELIKTPKYGVYHITNSDSCSWYEFAREIFHNAGVNIKLEPISSDEYPQPAERPKYSVLKNYNWKMEGFNEIRSYKDALKDYIKLLKEREE